jgi:hypothetical protein
MNRYERSFETRYHLPTNNFSRSFWSFFGLYSSIYRAALKALREKTTADALRQDADALRGDAINVAQDYKLHKMRRNRVVDACQ